MKEQKYFPALKDIIEARQRLRGCVKHTALMHSDFLSGSYDADVLLKREDLQVVRSYKLRGAYNKIMTLSDEQRAKGVVCASAGNHAQGVAFSCNNLGIKGAIFMPVTTPKQKVRQVESFGNGYVDIILTGDTYDASAAEAKLYCEEHGMSFVHPFDDERIIEGQATVGVEIIEDCEGAIDYLFVPIGGGGLLSGTGSYFRQVSPNTKIIGVEPEGASSMRAAMDAGEVVTLDQVDKFVDGASVKRVGDVTFSVAQQIGLDDIIAVPEGMICTTILEMYNREAIVVEPAGALSIAALRLYSEQIKGRRVVSIISGGNNDITRNEEIKERSLLFEGLKHYFIIRFPQRAGALMDFLTKVLGERDDITFFEYKKKTARENGPAVVGIELRSKDDFEPLIERMNANGIKHEYLNDQPELFELLV
ncbi:MAG: threonine ammonia-lyase [Rikenellaceae bacterium]